jgi:Leucine-rich repeat (LRR) protein
LYCYKNQLTSLDVSNNAKLVELYCYDNQLTSLDVSNNVKLITLYCYDNQLTSLDVSNNVKLIDLHCYDNKINKANMGALINSMPTRSASNNGTFCPKSTHAGEQNVFEKYHKVAAEAKNWEVYIVN